jgi:hypothetical protein
MGLKIDKLRAAVVEAGYVVQSMIPMRAPDSRVKVVMTVLKEPAAETPIAEPEPERMIVQPAPGLVQFREFEQIPGIGRQTASALRAAGLETIQDIIDAGVPKLSEVISVRAINRLHEYVQELTGDRES